MKAMAVLSLAALLPAIASATTWRVDPDGSGDFTTIQAAIDAATTGDDIVVAPGTYRESISYIGKDLWIHSSSGADATTISGEHVSSCVIFRNFESAAAVLEGFTLTAGAGTILGGERVGGAIFCLQSSPTIRGCRLVDNAAAYAAGIYVDEANPSVVDCVFHGNAAATYGGGIAGPSARPTIRDCLFEENSAGSGDGTIHLALSSPITHCVFRNNRARSGAAINAGGFGANYSIQDCVFEGNWAQGEHGGAIRIHEASVVVERCLFVSNSAAVDGGAIIVLDGAAPEIRNCTFHRNRAGRSGGAVAIWTFSSPILSNCIVSKSEGGGGVSCHDYSDPTFLCNDAWQNADGDYTGECGNPTGQDGNISADPQYCGAESGDFRIAVNSPCAPDQNPDCGLIGAYEVGCEGLGACCSPDGICIVTPRTGCLPPGIWQGPGTDCSPNPCLSGACCLLAVCDLHTEGDCIARGGTYQGNGTLCDPNPCPTSSVDGDGGLPETPGLSTIPNPATGDARIVYELPRAMAVTLEIFGPSGARVRRLVAGDRPAGRYSIRWDSRDDGGRIVPAGVYMIRMRTADGDRTWRAILAR